MAMKGDETPAMSSEADGNNCDRTGVEILYNRKESTLGNLKSAVFLVIIVFKYLFFYHPKEFQNNVEKTKINFQQRLKTKEKCTFCNLGKTIKTYCQFCNTFLCKNCHMFHKSICMLINHKTTDINDDCIINFVPLNVCSNQNHQHFQRNRCLKEKILFCAECLKCLCNEDNIQHPKDVLDLGKSTDCILLLNLIKKNCDIQNCDLAEKLITEVQMLLDFFNMIIEGGTPLQTYQWDGFIERLLDIMHAKQQYDDDRADRIKQPSGEADGSNARP